MWSRYRQPLRANREGSSSTFTVLRMVGRTPDNGTGVGEGGTGPSPLFFVSTLEHTALGFSRPSRCQDGPNILLRKAGEHLIMG